MTMTDPVAEFAAQYSFDATALLTEERDAVRAAVDCHAAINSGYVALPGAVLDNDPAVGLLWQLYERSSERVFGALVAMATSCAASSEILARTSIEATISIRYILRDKNRRLASYLQDHVGRADRQESLWRKAASRLSEPDRGTHLASCRYRRQAVDAMKGVVDAVNGRLVPAGNVPQWPSIEVRFKDLGDELSYRTLYARLCSEPHFDAEETLRYFIGKTLAPDLFERMAIETIMFSRFLLAEAVRAFAVSAKEFAQLYGMITPRAICAEAERTMHAHVLQLSEYIGAGPAK